VGAENNPADIRICFIGDSLVNGVGDPDYLGWTGRICADARRKGHDITHYNLGVRGHTSSDIAARWHNEAGSRLYPPYRIIAPRIVFSFGTNDTLLIGGQRRVSFEQSVENTSRIVSEVRTLCPALMVGPSPISDETRQDEIKALSDAFASICKSEGMPFLDVFDGLLASEVWMGEIMAGDGAHPGARGYDALARIVQEWSGWRHWFD
jgi:lysophospholipase L1-like esterase